MATRGRKPKPTAVKVLEGNPGKRPLNMYEPVPERRAPECPSWLNDEAKAEWDRLADKMVNLGTLQKWIWQPLQVIVSPMQDGRKPRNS